MVTTAIKQTKIRRQQQRIDTAVNWTNLNPLLLNGEIGIESVTNLYKIGDGLHKWNELTYANDKVVGTSKITVSTTPPTNPKPNEIWIDISGV